VPDLTYKSNLNELPKQGLRGFIGRAEFQPFLISA
jgi:hypothetical protein